MKIHPLLVSLSLAAAFTLGSLGCAKSPEDVCAHMEKLMAKEANAEVAKKMNKGCVASAKRTKENKGYFKYRKQSRCIVAAKSLNDIKDCE
jgi:hypothetical protein